MDTIREGKKNYQWFFDTVESTLALQRDIATLNIQEIVAFSDVFICRAPYKLVWELVYVKTRIHGMTENQLRRLGAKNIVTNAKGEVIQAQWKKWTRYNYTVTGEEICEACLEVGMSADKITIR